MARLKAVNGASSTLAFAVTTSAVVLPITVGDGVARGFPATGDYMMRIEMSPVPAGLYDPTKFEIVRATGRSADRITVVRSQEGTLAPATWPAGSVVYCAVTKGYLEELQAELDAKMLASADAAAAVAAMGDKGDSNPLNHDRYTDAEALAAAKTARLNELAAPNGAVAFAGQQATNLVDHVVADETAMNALTAVVGKRVFRLDTGHPYVCVEV
jgi:hypothetical protein